MNTDIEDFPEKFFAWLVQSERLPSSSGGEESSYSKTPFHDPVSATPEDCDIDNWELDDFDLLESEVLDATVNLSGTPEVLHPPSKPGDIPAVRDRFQAILKRRLQMEMQNKPPLFPWETEISEYESDASDYVAPELEDKKYLWIAQIEKLRLPVPIPIEVLAQLLDRCQTVVQSSMAEKAKLARVVEAIFPSHSRVLDKFAQKVLTLSKSLDKVDFSQTASKFPSTYEAAKQNEQMVLLLLAAQQIFGFLTLGLSPSNQAVEREWLSQVGILILQAEYQVEKGLIRSIRIRGFFPCGGSLRLQAGQAQAKSDRPDPGYLSVELFDLEPNQHYPLEVQFHQYRSNSLTFAICATT